MGESPKVLVTVVSAMQDGPKNPGRSGVGVISPINGRKIHGFVSLGSKFKEKHKLPTWRMGSQDLAQW